MNGCGHCETFMPVFDSLKIPKMKIEVKDGEHPNESIEKKRKDIHGYPSIFYYNDNNKSFNEYSNARQSEDLIAFYNENNKNKNKKHTTNSRKRGGKPNKTNKTKKTKKIKENKEKLKKHKKTNNRKIKID
jgi:hypothetical protein